MNSHAPGKDVDRLIVAAHRRFVKAMDGRLGAMSPEMKETYFSVLSKLVTKLETSDKAMREIMQEMMMEAMSEVLQVMQG
jgi:ABC-type Zn uptake system ZnuABC Zn-binding protein ZnuA